MEQASAPPRKRAERAWQMYDWANSAFSTTVIAGFFPIFFKQVWCEGAPADVSTARLAAVNAVAGLAVALAAPMLGALADHGGARRRWLMGFAAAGITGTVLLAFPPAGAWVPAALCFALASIGFSGSIIFYDAMLVDVTVPSRYHRVSAGGYSLGYLGGGLLLAAHFVLLMKGDVLGIGKGAAVRIAFFSVALWWLFFSMPLFRLRGPEHHGLTFARPGITAAWKDVLSHLRKLPRHRELAWFLVAFWLYMDGVHTIVRMAVDFGMTVGLKSGVLLGCLLITQVVGFPAALVFGRLGERFGARPALIAGLALYMGVTLFGSRVSAPGEFMALAALIGLVQGGVQSLSRSLFARLIPPDEAASWFGFYNLTGKFSAVVGPALMGLVTALTHDARRGLLSVGLLFVAGLLALLKVPASAERMAAREAA